MEAQPSTSYAYNRLLFKNDSGELEGYGNEAFTLLKYVFNEMKEEQNQNDKVELPLERAQRYTGLPINILDQITDLPINKITEINRQCVHEALISLYLKKKIVPTATELFQHLQDSLPYYEDIRSFRKKLVQMGYIFKKKADSFVVYEKPSIRFERFLYLKNIVQYREDKRQIYFITELGTSYEMVWNIVECKLEKRERPYVYYFALTSLKGVKCFKKVKEFDKNIFNDWILKDVIPYLETNSIVVLYNKEYCCDKFLKTPKKTSPSDIMIEWLRHHEIPFKDSMTKVELYTLIEKYTDVHTNLYKVDLWLKRSGHNVLRLPNCINELTPASHVCKVINKSLENQLKSKIEDIVADVSETELNTYNLMLANEETRLYNLEIKVDNILDTLEPSLILEKDLYLPSLSDSE